MYKMEGRVRYSECGEDNKLKIPAIINLFQDCTTENSEQIGLGHDFLRERKRAWILTSWQVVIHRRPFVREQMESCTWATGFKGFFGPRDFVLQTKDGEVLAQAHSLWVYLDTESGRPTKPTEEDIANYEVGEPLEMGNAPRKIKFHEDAVIVDTFPVHKYHIDTNHHMNNSKYVELACEALPDDFQVQEFRVEYRKAAVLGDVLILRRYEEEGHIVVGLCDAEDKPYAVVEFIGEN